MADYFAYIVSVIEAVKGNQYGLIAAAIFVIALAMMTISKNGSTWIRIIGMIIVAASSVGMSMAVLFQSNEEFVTGLNGDICLQADDCISKNCYNGPHEQVKGSSKKYCLAADHQCAVPGFDGVKTGMEIYSNGTKLTCADPGGSTAWQLYRVQ